MWCPQDEPVKAWSPEGPPIIGLLNLTASLSKRDHHSHTHRGCKTKTQEPVMQDMGQPLANGELRLPEAAVPTSAE